MNKQRRKTISKIANKINNFLTDINIEIEKVKFDEEMVFDNMPENLQGSMRGMESEEAIEILEECVDDISEIEEKLNELT